MRTHRSKVAVCATVATALCASALMLQPAPALAEEGAAPACELFDDAVQQVVKPRNDASLVTPWESEAERAVRYGFTETDGVLFLASVRPAEGLVEVHRLYRNVNLDFMVSADPTEWAVGASHEDQGTSFYASPVDAPCLDPVHRLLRSGKHRLAVEGQRDALLAEGWEDEGVEFYAAPAPVVAEPEPTPIPEPTTPPPSAPDDDTTFSFAVIPDTQNEVFGGDRFINRTRWLVDQQDELDLEFVTHTGDLVNWDTPGHEQYEKASEGMVPLEDAGIPYSIAIGNHDTQATGVGGSARDPRRTRELQRDTSTFNQYFDAERYGGVTGAFEEGKVDNIYSVYEAGGTKWMVLVLEMWPRKSVVEWAKDVVGANPDANVVVATHMYLDGGLNRPDSAGYGDTSPEWLYDNLVSQYPNIKVVLSGHVGQAGARVDTGENGNKIHSFLTTFHSPTSNPVRVFEVDTEADTLKTWVYGPWTDQTWGQYSKTVDVDWVE